MAELKPCLCGEKIIDVDYEKYGDICGCGIGCTNILCDIPMVVGFANTKERAFELAAEKWNRRADNGL
jgi:hypothetical protein